MPVTRSAGPQGPSVTVLVGLMRVKKSSLRYEKEFPRAFRRRKPQSGVVAPSEPLANPSKPPPQVKGKSRSNAIASGSTSPSQEAKVAAAVKRGLALLHDGHATTVEENRIFCQICNEWIELKKTYCVEDWLAHKRTCKQSRSGSSASRPKHIKEPSKSQPQSQPSPTRSKRVEKSVAKPPPPLAKHRIRSESERADILYNDPRIVTVESRRVRCGLCGLWIKLRNNTTYCPTPWLVHANRCVKRTVGSQPAPQLSRESTPSGLLSSSPESEG